MCLQVDMKLWQLVSFNNTCTVRWFLFFSIIPTVIFSGLCSLPAICSLSPFCNHHFTLNYLVSIVLHISNNHLCTTSYLDEVELLSEKRTWSFLVKAICRCDQLAVFDLFDQCSIHSLICLVMLCSLMHSCWQESSFMHLGLEFMNAVCLNTTNCVNSTVQRSHICVCR